MKQFLSIPTWFVYMMIRLNLPTHHPWYGKDFTLGQWTERATRLNLVIGFVFWTATAGLYMSAQLLYNITR